MADKPSEEKKRPSQHRIDTEGLKIFQSSLPSTKAFEFLYGKVDNDYGIDAQLQVFINEEATGDFFFVQIKSKEKLRYINDGKTISLSLDLKSAYYLSEKAQNPTALIAIDNSSKKVYWYPVQADNDLTNQLNRILTAKVTAKTLTVHIDIKNELTSQSYSGLYSYFQKAKLLLSQKSILRTETDETLNTGLKFIEKIEQQKLSLDGFEYRYRDIRSAVPNGVIFSVASSGGKVIDYFPSKDYRSELGPVIKLKAKFSNKSKVDKEKGDAFMQLLQNGTGSISLEGSNIDGYEISSGSKIIDSLSSDGKTMSIQITPAINKKKITLLLNNGLDEIENNAEIWPEDGLLHIVSLDSEVLELSTSFGFTDSDHSTLKFRVNNKNLNNVSHELRYLNFIKNKDNFTISMIDEDGFKRKIFGGDLGGAKIVNDSGYRFIVALKEIEDATNIAIPYPLPEDMSRDDVANVYWVHRLVTQNKITQDMTMNFKLKDIPPEPPVLNGAIQMTQNHPEISLLGKSYVLKGFTQDIKGIISELTVTDVGNEKSYKVRVKKAEITISKE